MWIQWEETGIAGDILEELETYAEAGAHAWPGGEFEFHLYPIVPQAPNIARSIPEYSLDAPILTSPPNKDAWKYQFLVT